MTPIWVTVLVAVISMVASLSSSLSAQWVGGVNQRKLALIDREAKRDERQQQSREDSCMRFLVAARTFQSTARSSAASESIDSHLNTLKEAAAYIELQAPELADSSLAVVLTAAERWHALLLSQPATSPAIEEADGDFRQALAKLRDLMLDELGTRRRHKIE